MFAQAFALHQQGRFLLQLPNIAVRPLPPVARILLIVIGLTASTQAIAVDRSPEFCQFAAAEIDAKGMTEVEFQTVAKGYRSGVRTPLQVVARSQTEWEKLWRQHSSIEATSPLPIIDFEKHIIVGLFLGDKPTGGYNVAITRAEQSDSDLIAYYEETLPRPGGIVIQTLTQPFHIVRVTRANYSNVIFRRLS